jgi:acyl carrier protein
VNEKEVKEILIKVLQEIQSISGSPEQKINDDTCPLRDLNGFDSMRAVESTIPLSEYLNCDIKPNLGLFAVDGRALSVIEITINLMKYINKSEPSQRRIMP